MESEIGCSLVTYPWSILKPMNSSWGSRLTRISEFVRSGASGGFLMVQLSFWQSPVSRLGHA